MSDLITNLNSIYTTKLQIKEVIGTDSDVFSDYPAYIEAAISGGGLDWDDVAGYGYIVPAGTKSILSNGTGINVGTYAYVDVAVEAEIPEGYIIPAGELSIEENGTFDVTSYASATVSVPVPDGYTYVQNITYNMNSAVTLNEQGLLLGLVQAPGYEAVELHYGLENLVNQNSYEITTNGTFDVLTYGTAYVNVPQSGIVPSGTKIVELNGNYDVTAYERVDVNVPIDWAYVAACGYVYVAPSYTSVTWPDLTYIDENSNVRYKGPADGTEVQMTDTLVDGNTVLGFNQVTSEVISQLTNYGATDVANHLNSYIGSYLNFFAENDSSPMSAGLMAIVTPNALTAGSYATVTGPIYDLSPYQSGGLWMWLEVDATDVVINS